MKRISTLLCLGVMTIWGLSFPVTAVGQSDFGADTNLWDAIAQTVIISDTAKVELFVMSQCPYGVMAEQAIAPILEEFGEFIDFKLYFIARETPDGGFRSMHGQPEVEEDIRQLVMAKYYPDKYLDYVVARADNYQSDDWEQLAADLGIDPEKVNEIASGAEGEELFRENIKKGNQLGIGASPTLLIDDEKYTGRAFPLSAASGNGSPCDYSPHGTEMICLDIAECPPSWPMCGNEVGCPNWVISKDWECTGAIIPPIPIPGLCRWFATPLVDCDAMDGCYPYGDGCENRDYTCSGASCVYTYSNRHTDYYEDWVFYCNGNEVWKHRFFHDFRCVGTCVEYISWVDDQKVTECVDPEYCECGQCLPVELSSFTATAGDGKVTLHWVTESETDNLGFDIYRSLSEDGEYERITHHLIEGAGSSSSKHEYTYTDQRLTNGVTYYYKLEDVDFAGNRTMHGPVSGIPMTPHLQPETQASAPDRYSLSQNSPNPFNLDTYIKFAMKESGHVRLSIYNALGRRIRVLVDAGLAANEYTVHWDSRDNAGRLVASGHYFYGIECYTSTGNLSFIGSRKMVLLR